MQRLDRVWVQTPAPKVPEWPSYNNFRKVTQNPHFLKKWKGGTKGNFSKIAQKIALVWKAKKHSGGNNIILYFVCPWSAKTAKDFGAKSGSKSTRLAKLWQFSQGHPKPCKDWTRFFRKQRLEKCPNGQVTTIFARSPKTRIFLKCAKGGPIEIFQKLPNKMPST